jgi:hypothetical protein
MRYPMTHLQFKNVLCKALLVGWTRCNVTTNTALTHRPSIHMPSHSTLKRLCVVFKIPTLCTYCYQYDFKFMCLKEGCFQNFHEALEKR